MLHIRPFALMLVPALALLPALSLVACVADSTDDESNVGVTSEAIPSNGVHFVGTYTNSDTMAPGDLSRIVLKKDGTFYTETFVQCFKAPCQPIAASGHYTLYRQDTITYFQLYDAAKGSPMGKFQYVLMGDFLNLRSLSETSDGHWMPMLRSPAAFCMINNDCAQQDLLPGPCAGEYVCQTENICNYHCGIPTEMSTQ